MIHIENLVKRYGEVLALDHLNLDIAEGEIFGLLGPNGSGKTTAINCLLALLKYDKGEITVFGECIRRVMNRSVRSVLFRRMWLSLNRCPCMKILIISAAFM